MSYTKAGPFRFYRDGTVTLHGPFGGLKKDRSPVVGYEGSDGTRNKETVGRAVGAVLTGGLSLLGSSKTGQLTVMVITQDWAHTWVGPPSWTGMYRSIIEQCALAERRAAMAAQQHPSTRG